MSSYRRVFDPLDLEIIDRVDAAWARVEAQRSLHDCRAEDQLKERLRKRLMMYAATGTIDFDTLYDKVTASETTGR